MKVKKAWHVDVYGAPTVRIKELEGKELSLAKIYPFIGNNCHVVERVSLKKGVDMWVDEEGLLKGNSINRKATKFYQKAYDSLEVGIVGNAVIIDNTKDGDFIKD